MDDEAPPIAAGPPPSAPVVVQPERTPGRVRALIRTDGSIELTPLVEGAPTIRVQRLADLHTAFVRARAIVLRPRLRPFVTALADALAATLKR